MSKPVKFSTVEDVPDQVWAAAREAAAAGVPLAAIASRAGLGKSWLEARSRQEKWMTPERRAALLREYEAKDPAMVQQAIDEITLATAALSSDRALLHRGKIADLTAKKLEEATKTIAAPKTWKDVQILDTMARKALGLEDDAKPTAMIQMNLLSTTATVEREA